jgi:sulfite reductase alpha subunit-like flavoprotein
LDEFSGDELKEAQTAVFVMATFGEGEVTDNAKKCALN